MSTQNKTEHPCQIKSENKALKKKNAFSGIPGERRVQLGFRSADLLFGRHQPQDHMGMLLCSVHRLSESSGVSRAAEICVWVCRPLTRASLRLHTGQGPESSTLPLNFFLSWGSKVNPVVPSTWCVHQVSTVSSVYTDICPFEISIIDWSFQPWNCKRLSHLLQDSTVSHLSALKGTCRRRLYWRGGGCTCNASFKSFWNSSLFLKVHTFRGSCIIFI